MTGVYVHGSDMHFNAVVYCLMRSFHLPQLEGQELPLVDTWFAVAAIQHNQTLTLANNNVETMSLHVVDADGRTVKGSRVNLNTAPQIDGYLLGKVKKEAFDIPLWEKTQNKPFPYETMFNKELMQRRLRAAPPTSDAAHGISSSNEVYQEIRKVVRPPCRTCGGRK